MLAGCGVAALATPAPAQPDLPAAAELERLLSTAASSAINAAAAPPSGAPAGTALAAEGAKALRLEVEVGRLDPRLKLAPCQSIEAYLPPGMRALGNTRVGLRCRAGAVHWNVYLPVTVKLFGRALVARAALPAGTVLGAEHLAQSEVDLAASSDPALRRDGAALGRTLARAVAAGEPLRQGDLKQRRWFEGGETVRIIASGQGYAVSAEGQALGPGLDGQMARVRTESGRVVTGTATGVRRVELAL